MIREFILAVFLAAVSSTVVLSQTKTDYNKWEVYGGYSNGQVERGIDSGNSLNAFFRDRRPFNGFEASGVYNFNRYFGVKGDVSGTYNKTHVAFTLPNPTGPPDTLAFDSHDSLYNFLGGIQVKDNASESRFKPFAHALVGVGLFRSSVRNLVCTGNTICPAEFSNSETGFAGAFGGGLDVKLSNKIDLRAFQADYNPVNVFGKVHENVRFGVGFVFK
jgi:hypothetical protein